MSYTEAFSYLESKGFADRVRQFEESTATCALAAAALGCTEAEICKSMAFKGLDGRAILVLAAGDVKVNSGKVKRTFGLKASMLDPEETLRYTNHQVGGVCPFGLTPDIDVYADESLKRFTTVYPACGTPNTAVQLLLEELISLSGSKGWVDVTVPKEPVQA